MSNGRYQVQGLDAGSWVVVDDGSTDLDAHAAYTLAEGLAHTFEATRVVPLAVAS